VATSPLVSWPDQIVRFLRIITSQACRGEKHVPSSAIAAMYGVSRLALYRVLWTGRVSADMVDPLADRACPRGRQASVSAQGSVLRRGEPPGDRRSRSWRALRRPSSP
jgi:hypothetical protein